MCSVVMLVLVFPLYPFTTPSLFVRSSTRMREIKFLLTGFPVQELLSCKLLIKSPLDFLIRYVFRPVPQQPPVTERIFQ